jgi:hypothetical protein
MNKKGQFSIIAALLVAVVLITTVVVTYSTIRNSQVSDQPQIQSAIDETNLALKEVLGFTVGYYGSVLESTGNTTYAQEHATEYLHSGLEYTANTHPEWGTSFDVTNSQLYTYWYATDSQSNGNLSVSYNLTGLGITGMTYDTSCSLNVQITPTVNNQVYLAVTKDENEPLIDLGKGNFKFYRYDNSSWNFVIPTDEPLAYSNGTYQMNIPDRVDANSYLIQVEDQRGIIVVAASYSYYICDMAWNVTKTQSVADHYVDLNSSSSVGTHSNFTAMQKGPDLIMDNLTEGITTQRIPDKWSLPIDYDRSTSWATPTMAYDNNTSTFASLSFGTGWSAPLILKTTSQGLSCRKIQYFIDRDSDKVDQVQVDVSLTNGTWVTVKNDGGTWGNWANITFTQEMTVTMMRLQFHNSGHNSHTAYVKEAQFLQSGTPQKCGLDLEVQWTNVNYTNPNQQLWIFPGNLSQNEGLRVDVKNNSQWDPLITLQQGIPNSIPVSQYITSSNFTIRFKDTDPNDPIQDTWQIDAALLRTIELGNSSITGTIVVELLQNGTMRWLGQNLQRTTKEFPIPPIPVKSIHVNQTIAGVSSEVPFQTEDWASDYRIPLGLTSNASVFSSRTMLVFLANSNVSRVTLWWNGSDTATQTPYAYTDRYFTGDDVSNIDDVLLNNTILSLRIQRTYESAYGSTVFKVTSTQNGSTATARFMRINGKNSTHGDTMTPTIYHGIIRDIVQTESEWDNHGAPGCPNVYAHIVIILPANVTYYFYRVRLIFLDSQQDRTITDLCPIQLTVATGSPQTENGTSDGSPIVSNSTGIFYNPSPYNWTHHWSQFISGNKGAGIIFTDYANQQLYFFDNATTKTGAIKVSKSTVNVIELQPVSSVAQVSFKEARDATWYGAVATFDGTMPIYKDEGGGLSSGLWMIAEYPPTVTVTTST